MYKRVPSLKDSNPSLLYLFLFQLDVTFILSPTLFNQVATVPSVIVSLWHGDNDSLVQAALDVFFFVVWCS
jgi:hypothetical protein